MDDWNYYSCDMDMCLSNYGKESPEESFKDMWDGILFRINSGGQMEQFGVDTYVWTPVGQRQN